MYNFFLQGSDVKDGNTVKLTTDFNHIKNVLRMSVGDKVYVSENARTHLCQITGFDSESVLLQVVEENAIDTSLPISITLFQGLPKADKLELIIQKAVELGTDVITPVEMKNCVVKLESKKKEQKRERWQLIAQSAAKQSKRNNIPNVSAPVSFDALLKLCADLDLLIVPYENKDGMNATLSCLKEIKKDMKIGVLIGPEGGFDDSEVQKLKALPNTRLISLGKRILRTETASITALSMIMLYSETCL